MTVQELEQFIILDELNSTIDRLLSSKRSASLSPLRILEAGCGSLSHLHLQEDDHITGIDISQKQLDRNPHLSERILGDIQIYDFPPRSFDLIVCFWVLEHVSNPSAALYKFIPALKDDGILVIGVPNVMSVKGLITKFTPHWLHVWIYRYVFNYKLAGIDDNAPFHTTMRLAIAPDAILKFAKENSCVVTYFSTFEDYRQEELRQKLKLTRQVWTVLKGIVQGLTLGKIKADSTSYTVVLEKKVA
ncbi:MAG: methyltransferase domain-containing protein [Thermosynechococcaceae cyanobacterium MS004]|nr:methyltransferase domain-containing protein [Thermosynechococcaceae cyanobacterium MS004]